MTLIAKKPASAAGVAKKKPKKLVAKEPASTASATKKPASAAGAAAKEKKPIAKKPIKTGFYGRRFWSWDPNKLQYRCEWNTEYSDGFYNWKCVAVTTQGGKCQETWQVV